MCAASSLCAQVVLHVCLQMLFGGACLRVCCDSAQGFDSASQAHLPPVDVKGRYCCMCGRLPTRLNALAAFGAQGGKLRVLHRW
jgi:hypothetical protein